MERVKSNEAVAVPSTVSGDESLPTSYRHRSPRPKIPYPNEAVAVLDLG
jgi:hypothetical protein